MRYDDGDVVKHTTDELRMLPAQAAPLPPRGAAQSSPRAARPAPAPPPDALEAEAEPAAYSAALWSTVREEEEEAEEDVEDVPCAVCGLRDDPSHTLLCDGEGCEKAYHLHCLQPPLSQVPTGTWLCPECNARWRETEAGSRQLARALYEAEVREKRNLRRQPSKLQ